MKEFGEVAACAVKELIEKANLGAGDVIVIGCSSSEIVGGSIGKNSSFETAKEVFDGIYSEAQKRNIFIAAQCCEHLNRALVVETALAEKKGLEKVSARPRPKAGGSFATAAYESFSSPALVERIQADAGIDIGDTLIGMHLKNVAVPVRLSVNKIGNANLVCARCRPKYIGGKRTEYEEE